MKYFLLLFLLTTQAFGGGVDFEPTKDGIIASVKGGDSLELTRNKIPLSISLSGNFDASQPTLYLVVSGDIAVLSWDNLSHTSLSQPASADGFIPQYYRPAFSMINVYNSIDETFIKRVEVTASGQLKFFYKDYAGVSQQSTTTNSGSITWVLK